MSQSPLRSLLITPDLRRRLQQRYEDSQRLTAQPRPDYRRIHELLAECVRADPANILYLNALLANLRRRDASEAKSWWRRMWSSTKTAERNSELPAANALIQQSDAALRIEYSVLQRAPDLLWHRQTDIALYQRLAAAAAELDFDQVELRYVRSALERFPDDRATMQALARALMRQGRFEDAMEIWRAVLARQPDDTEAQQAMADLGGGRQAETDRASNLAETSDADGLRERARLLQDAGDFFAAEDCLAKAQAVLGGDLNVLTEREQLRIQHSAQRVEIAQRRAASDPHRKAQQLVQRFADEQIRLQIEILNARAERVPTDVDVRVNLATCLKQAGNFSGAVQRLEEAERLKPNDATVLVELGECWQHLRQFAKALDFYERAIAAASGSAGEIATLAHHRAGVLAAAVGQRDAARDHLAAVLAVDPAYKDARERLDKLGPN